MSNVFDHFPVFELDDIILRQIDKADAPEFFEYISDPMVKKYLSDEDIPKSIQSAEEELNYWAGLFPYQRSIYWGVASQKTNKLIGTCGFNTWSRTHKRAEVSYDLSRKYWNKGIMTKCVRTICDFAIVAMRVDRIQATVVLDNASSIKLLEKLGFQREGTLRSYAVLQNQIKDSYMYSLLSRDLTF
jgi:ribosomal-protein-alanine N-acetyltransferase